MDHSRSGAEGVDQAYAQRDSGLIGTKVAPLLKSLHNDPRYAALLKKNVLVKRRMAGDFRRFLPLL